VAKDLGHAKAGDTLTASTRPLLFCGLTPPFHCIVCLARYLVIAQDTIGESADEEGTSGRQTLGPVGGSSGTFPLPIGTTP